MKRPELLLPPQIAGLRCVRCGHESTDPWQWGCPACGPEVRMDVVFEGPLEARGEGIWRYRDRLPLRSLDPCLNLRLSPVTEAPRLAGWLGVERAVVKDDGVQASGSSKDRASLVGVSMALQVGAERIACASTGNAASSTACLAARVGLPATIFVPRRAPAPKVAQLRVFGATVLRVDADYDRTWELCNGIASQQPAWFNRNCAQNPYLVEGKKTAGLELADQLRERMTDWVAISVGDGCSVAGLCKGLIEAAEAGWIPHLPKVLAVQAAGAAPLVAAAWSGADPVIPSAETVADSLCVGHPRNPDKALQYVARTGGSWIAVEDSAILEALVRVPPLCGVFGEPAAATTFAGVRQAVAQGMVRGSVTVLVTGSGLKDPSTALTQVGGPIDVPADPEAVLSVL